MKGKVFKLHVFENNNGCSGLALYQQSINGQVNPNRYKLVVRVWGTPLQVVTSEVLNLIKSCGYHASSIKKGQKEPLLLDEEKGVRLGLLFLAVKPLSKLARIEEVKDAVCNMASEEVYYWFSRCVDGNERRRNRRAFRIMFSKE
jgi:hypothetical protein